MKNIILTAILLSFSVSSVAESRYQERRSNQKDRISNGVEDGSLNKKEARRLRDSQKEIRETAQEYRSDGVMTKKERRKLNRAQERQSIRIHRVRNNDR